MCCYCCLHSNGAWCPLTHPLISCPHIHGFPPSPAPLLPFSISESFPLSKSFSVQLFFLLGLHAVLRPPEWTDVRYAIRIHTWENMTLVRREHCSIKCSKQSSTQLRSYYFTASFIATSHTCELVIQCHKTCRASCLFALKMLHKVVQLYHWIIDLSAFVRVDDEIYLPLWHLCSSAQASQTVCHLYTHTNTYLCNKTVICLSLYSCSAFAAGNFC